MLIGKRTGMVVLLLQEIQKEGVTWEGIGI